MPWIADVSREGAIRFRVDGHYASATSPVPVLVDLPTLLDAADAINSGKRVSDQSFRRLFDASGSLGGARPKASLVDRGILYMAKFPRANGDDWDIIGWEAATLDLARQAGIDVPDHRVISITSRTGDPRTVLLTKRFDRKGGRLDGRRIPYMSLLTLLGARDGESGDWLDLADFVSSESPSQLPQVWRRAVFDTAIGDTDDHMRNHGFLHQNGQWVLSPAFDMNPTPIGAAPSRYGLSFIGKNELTISDLATNDVLDQFGVGKEEAMRWLASLMGVLSSARLAARRASIDANSTALMLPRFESACKQLRQILGKQRHQKLSR